MLRNFADLEEWIDQKLDEILLRMPRLVKEQPDSFACGQNVGYKQALLDLSRIIERDLEPL